MPSRNEGKVQMVVAGGVVGSHGKETLPVMISPRYLPGRGCEKQERQICSCEQHVEAKVRGFPHRIWITINESQEELLAFI